MAKHLSANYGTRALQIAEIGRDEPALLARLTPTYPIILAEIIFAVEQEYALTAVDVLARRTRLAFLNADEAEAVVPKVIDTMAPLLGWSPAQRAAEADRATEYLKGMR